ncbi:uncharacterized protein LOC143352861 [Halictus rubicundus]|uniref:uncharacterized protein LOC143352861 n=1 Tax=Halictus rubicundus TaxID=77578 RepID=UPI004035ACBF
MAGILTKFGKHRYESLISFLVVGSADLCQKVSEGLHQSAKVKQWNIVVHQCEFVTDIVKLQFHITVDFIIFVYDRRSHSLTEVETNISLIDEHYIICGAVCLVNCKEISSSIGFISHESAEIRNKYNIRFLSANVSKPQSCVQLGNRILNLTEAILGVTSGIPIIGI